MTYQELKKLFRDYESGYPKTHLTAYITFSSFGPDNKNSYDWKGRTYTVSSDNKAFQPNKGGCSIFGSCLDGSDPNVRLERFMQEELGGEKGWRVEDCCIVGYLLIECNELSISEPKLFYTHSEAAEYMLAQLAEKGEFDFEQMKKDYLVGEDLYAADWYEANRNDAWLAGPCVGWRWEIKTVRIYSPLHIAFDYE